MSDALINLRRLTTAQVTTGVAIIDLPIVFTGNWKACDAYAATYEFTWRSSQNVFGGYYTAPNGDCLLPT